MEYRRLTFYSSQKGSCRDLPLYFVFKLPVYLCVGSFFQPGTFEAEPYAKKGYFFSDFVLNVISLKKKINY